MYVVVKGEYLLRVNIGDDNVVTMSFNNLSQLKSVFKNLESADALTVFTVWKREFKLDMSDGLMTVVETQITEDF